MSCKNHTQPAQQFASQFGGTVTIRPETALMTYQYFQLSHDRQFVVADLGIVVKTNVVQANPNDPDARKQWILSYRTTTRLATLKRFVDSPVLVYLKVWGRIRDIDNDLVASEYAQIIGYDQDDYHYALYKMGLINYDKAKKHINKDTDGYMRLLWDNIEKLNESEVEELTDMVVQNYKHALNHLRADSPQQTQILRKAAFANSKVAHALADSIIDRDKRK